MKPSDNGLISNYHALAPFEYKRSAIRHFVHRNCTPYTRWRSLRCSLEKKKKIVENMMNNIESATLIYNKKCDKQKRDNNAIRTAKFLKVQKLLSVSADKRNSFDIMKKENYSEKYLIYWDAVSFRK